MRDSVGLDVAGPDVAAHDKFARLAFDGLEQFVVAARPAVALHRSGLLALHALEHPIHRRRAHRKNVHGYVVRNMRDAGAVLFQPFLDVRLEVGRAWASGFAPYPNENRPVALGVGRSAAFVLPELPAARQEPVRVLPLVAGRLAHIVQHALALCTVCLGVRPPLRAYVFACCQS